MAKIPLMIVFCLAMHVVQAKEQIFSGATALEDITLEAIKVNGSFKGKNITIKKRANISGSCTCKKSKIGTLNSSGSCKIKDSDIKELNVSGSLRAENSKVEGNCTASGAVEFENMKVYGKTTVSGACKIKSSTLQDFEYSGRKAEIKDTTLASIHVKKLSERGIQTLELKGKTVVQGDVTFDDVDGLLEMDHEADIQGDIIKAGRIVTKDEIEKEKKNKSNDDDDDDDKKPYDFFKSVKKWFKELF
ncbi:hypothetical protein COB28_04730 [Candidatus Dependentiae bacterium]|nr:MAG: hypothetical protein COB28_04730 [Candidatus Dependentiae bacterium]